MASAAVGGDVRGGTAPVALVAAEPSQAVTVASRMACSMSAGLISALATNPTETIRVRWQVLSMGGGAGAAGQAAAEGGLLRFGAHIVRTEGLIAGLWRPGLTGWMASFGGAFGIRMGVYEYVRLGLERATGRERSTATAFAAGMCTGALSNSTCCPFFQAKNRLQARAGPGIQGGGLIQELSSIVREGGAPNLYRGVPALFCRGGLISGGQLSGYDFTKRYLIGQGVAEGPIIHVAASSVSAVTAVLASAPADVVLNRYQAAPSLGKHYASLGAVVAEIMKEEGPLAFYRGVVPNIAKFLPLFLMSMPLFEQLRRLAGLGYLT
mmetsp:Transcript_164749/g.528568  ORF Transcript_164749/g.528568 Transcript_164749/m.528568 type:complete len:324 (-) Transcript_164749:129-1100(-)